jgi:hypothetical protein
MMETCGGEVKMTLANTCLVFAGSDWPGAARAENTVVVADHVQAAGAVPASAIFAFVAPEGKTKS